MTSETKIPYRREFHDRERNFQEDSKRAPPPPLIGTLRQKIGYYYTSTNEAHIQT